MVIVIFFYGIGEVFGFGR